MSSLKATPLFRFVHHRSPELYSQFEEEQKYVLRPDFEDPYQLAIRQNPDADRWPLLASVVLPEVYSIEVLKEMSLYAFSQWLAKHKHDVSTAELLERMQENYDFNDITRIAKKPALSGVFIRPLPEASRRALWTQLMYQVVHQENLYAKEIIIQLLVADHVVRMLITDTTLEKVDELNKIILGARVVLPHHFFVVPDTAILANKTEGFINKRVRLHSTSEQVLKNDAVHELQTRISTLKKELQRADGVYQNAYQKAKDQYDKQYQREVAPLIKEHQATYERELRKWCDVLPANHEYNPLDPCKQAPYIEEPNYPEYSFNYPYPDERFYNEQLSEDSYTFLTSFQRNSGQYRLLPSVSPISLSPISDFEVNDFNTYPSPADILPSFNDLSDNLTPIVQPLPGHQTSVIATPTGPFVFNALLLEPYHYRLFASMRGDKLQLHFFIGLPDTESDLSTFQITAENQNSSLNITSQQVLNKNMAANLLSFRNPLNDIITQATLPSYRQFTGAISFNDEDTIYEFGFTLDQLLGIIPTEPEDFSELIGVLTVRPNGNNGGVAVFVPSGFGMKDIGIADYNRVEQSTYCYVEGDVQHIENIMAREFKEMSTRRFLGKTTSQTDRTETESEQLSELNTSNRFEMHNEISQVLGSSRDFQTNLGLNTKFGGKGGSPEVTISSQTGFASHQSVENSSHQAVTQSKEVTERALERVVNKVMQERTQTIVEEFEENNSHGFDNRKGDQHVVGVYRWVDKVVKNQVINYGKRQMMEFMIPQPSKLYRHSKSNASTVNENLILMPKDPRKEIGTFRMKTQNDVNDTTLAYWSGIYKVELPKKPESTIVVSHAFEGKDPNFTGKDDGKVQMVAGTGDFEIPEDYIAKKIHYQFMTSRREFAGFHSGRLTIAGYSTIAIGNVPEGSSSGTILTSGTIALKNKVFYSFQTSESPIIHGTLRAVCELTNEAATFWRSECFNKIIAAYEEAKKLYDELVQPKNDTTSDEKTTHPLLYLEIVSSILKKNCISYLIDQNPNATLTYGKTNLTRGKNFTNYEVNVNGTLDQYASFVKFIEQAFEWDIMSFNFYPFYWGKREDWKKSFTEENLDPLFRQFLRSGMARVIVTVRPGFEEAVNFYLQTGRIWNGGEVPVIGDPLFLSLVDELRSPTGKKVGKAWRQRVPTALTILQADSIGLKVEKALPCTCDDEKFEDNLGNLCSENSDYGFTTNPDALIGGPIESSTPTSLPEGVRLIENIDINNGNLQLTTAGKNREIVAQISIEAIKREMYKE